MLDRSISALARPITEARTMVAVATMLGAPTEDLPMSIPRENENVLPALPPSIVPRSPVL